MKKHKAGTLIMVLLVSLLWVVNASGQTGISVNGEKARLNVSFSAAPAAGLAGGLGQVSPHVQPQFSHAATVRPLARMSGAFETAIENIAPLVMFYKSNASARYELARNAELDATLNAVAEFLPFYSANAGNTRSLKFPQELVNDQTPPTLEGFVSSLANAEDPSILDMRWTVSEFAQSTLQYGTQSGSYSESLPVDSYRTVTNVSVSGLQADTTYYGRIQLTDLSGNESTSEEFSFSLAGLPPPSGKPLVLIYAVLDNNLGEKPEDVERLIHNVEAGAHDGINVRLMIDMLGDNNSYVYDIKKHDAAPCITPVDPICNGHYVEGTNMWEFTENSAHPHSLYTFVTDAVAAYPGSGLIVPSLVGHGNGWSANVLPSQPTGWKDQPSTDGENQEQVGGLLWDDTLGNGEVGSRSLSTKALGIALKWITDEIDRPIDMLYLDACSMGMIEVAYELRDYTTFMLASPNTAWTSFAYDVMLTNTRDGDTAEAVGNAWLEAEAAVLDAEGGYPYTLTLIDLRRIGDVATAISDLADAMIGSIGDQMAILEQAYAEIDRYESDYDGSIIAENDHYVDLISLAEQLSSAADNGSPVRASLDAVQGLLNAENGFIRKSKVKSGKPWMDGYGDWQWKRSRGFGIYMPRRNTDPKRVLYNDTNLAWAADTTWDEFLEAFWGGAVQAAAQNEMPVCESSINCEKIPSQLPLQVQEPTPEPIVTPVPTATAVPEIQAETPSVYLPFVNN